jgi:hypothetical protein
VAAQLAGSWSVLSSAQLFSYDMIRYYMMIWYDIWYAQASDRHVLNFSRNPDTRLWESTPNVKPADACAGRFCQNRLYRDSDLPLLCYILAWLPRDHPPPAYCTYSLELEGTWVREGVKLTYTDQRVWSEGQKIQSRKECEEERISFQVTDDYEQQSCRLWKGRKTMK